ncbi:hypothetical protein HYY71_04270 [Candidatus Woesearchaeota archaeon]|nr:hypothetical protein [Candidatus Woesearchaeota archaeon]
MRLCRNKKSVSTFLVGILIVTGAFISIILFWEGIKNKAEAKTIQTICRSSVSIREYTQTEIREPVTPSITSSEGVKIGSFATPLFCKTIDMFLPEKKDASEEDIKKDFAELMASCWRDFGEGRIPDPFKKGNFATKNCHICFTVSLRETSKFKGEIKATDMRKYMFENPYQVAVKGDNCVVNGGFCIESESKEDCGARISADPSYLLMKKRDIQCLKEGKSSCCYTEYGCWNKGGKCSATNPDADAYAEYTNSKWKCPSNMKCYAKKENYYSYGNYIQSYGGLGNFIVLTDIKPGQTYAISFASPTKECEWCTRIGLGAGGAAAAASIAFLTGIPTGGIGTLVTISVFGAGYIAGKAGTEWTVDKYQLLSERKINTVYLTTLEEMQKEQKCNIVS